MLTQAERDLLLLTSRALAAVLRSRPMQNTMLGVNEVGYRTEQELALQLEQAAHQVEAEVRAKDLRFQARIMNSPEP